MKRISSICLVIGLALVSGCLERSAPNPGSRTGTLLQIHFAGLAALDQGTNATMFRSLAALPASGMFRDDLLGKLARAPRQFWKSELPADAKEHAELVRPLLEDLVRAEWLLEVRGPVGRSETVLAVRLADGRARVWNDNLTKLVTAWNLGTATPIKSEATGWEARRAESSQVIQFQRAGQWACIGLGQKQLTLLPSILQKVAKGEPLATAPSDTVLEFDADLPALAIWFPIFAHNPLPPVHATVSGRGETLRTEMTLRYSGKLPIKLEPWQLPRNFINDPLVSFTVARGLAPLWSNSKMLSDLQMTPAPNQIVTWGMAYDQTQLFFAFPTGDPTNTVATLATQAPGFAAHFVERAVGSFLYLSNRAEVVWQGLPFLIPNLRALRDGSQGFVAGGTVPNPPLTNPPPAELYAQFLDRPDLVYYDWELTHLRLSHARQFYQLLSILNSRQVPGTNAPVERWLVDVSPHLGNTVTEVALSSPTELSVVRKSVLGLTGFELATLARWVDSPSFPFGFEPPPPMRRPNASGAGKKTSRSPKAAPPAKSGPKR